MLNPGPGAPASDAPVDVLVPNRGELEALAGRTRRPGHARARPRRLAGAVVVTLGEGGRRSSSRASAPSASQAPQVHAVDTTGAGDAFCGALAQALAEGADARRGGTLGRAGRGGERHAHGRAGRAAAARGRARRLTAARSTLGACPSIHPRSSRACVAPGRWPRACCARCARRSRRASAPASSTRSPPRSSPREGGRSGPIITYGFPGAICISVGDEAVHGIPGPRKVKAGDLVKLDVAVELDGYFGDTATTVAVEPARGADTRLIAATRAALTRGMAAATAGARLRDVGAAVERIVEARGFSVLRELTGHGIGRGLHEAPTIYNYAHEDARARLHEGLVVTIEPMIATGTRKVLGTGDGWTVVTANGANSAHEEHTIVVTSGEPIVLTAA